MNLAEYGSKIKSELGKSVTAIFEIGKLLHAAREEHRGEFGRLFRDDHVPFSQDNAEKYMAIARDPRLTNSAKLRNLPPSWTTLYDLTRLKGDEWDEAEAQGLIRCDVRGSEIKKFINERRQLGRLGVLLTVLDKARAAVDATGALDIDQAQDFIFMGDRVVAYNGHISISAPMPEDTGLALTVKAKKLYHILKNIPEDDLELGFGKDDNLLVTSESTKATIKADPLAGDLAELLDSLNLDALKEKDWQDLPEGFDDAIKLCLFSAGKDPANVAYNCLHMLTEQLVSTDNLRISRYVFLQPKAEMDFLMPIKAAEELVRHKVGQFNQGEAWAHFRGSDGLVFSARIKNEDFPDCDEFFEFSGKTIELPPELSKALSAVLVFAPGEVDEDRVAQLHFKKGNVVCVAETWDSKPWYEIYDGKVACKGEPIKIFMGRIERTVPAPGMQPPPNLTKLRINPVFFMEILQHVTTMKVGKGGTRVLFKAGNFAHVMNLPAGD